jgi:hypothetical protein
MQKTTLEEAFAAAERDAEQKRKDARLFIAGGAEAVAAALPKVRVRVLKQGHDKVSMGQHVPRLGDGYYERGDHFEVEEGVALALEDRGYVEIVQPEVEPEPVPMLPLKKVAG